ncbi:hypothetical protein [Thioclava electrotropha]|uniref:Uncharacterized protein n=1 Tax=Thioclava electrotropha TaxID=1549850 RepID=A0ABX6YWS2_9RHOB|nr:hypothetical protein [Thioclava electrotropha]QPZ92176.1 hypothetical protein AKL02_015635 [Thioclava electrotropha]
MRILFTCFFLVAVPGLSVAQPLSQSMAQCSGLFHGVGTMMSDPARAEKLDRAGMIWRGAAIKQAEAEGRADAAIWVAGHQRESFDDWRGRGKMAAFSQDFRDWASYCRKLGKAKGIKTDLGS